MKNCIIVDVDGTIAIRGDRSPYDWSKVGEDEPKKTIINLAVAFTERETRLIFMSGRDSVCRLQTEMWLEHHVGQYDQLFMRTEGDNRKDTIIKKELYEKHIKDKYSVMFVLDDRDCVVEMWRSLGLTCLQVAPGAF